MHKGKIEVESEDNKGSKFSVYIPLGKKHLFPQEIVESIETQRKVTDLVIEEYDQELKKKKLELEFSFNNEKPVLLIVEDNYDLRKYIIEILSEYYQISEAEDGEEGFRLSIEHIPDLIISDIMMPKMDGIELCEKLKTDERTSHIPVILLTAKATSNDKIIGYETGADDYIMKPFEEKELKVRIKNLLEQRKRIHEHFRKHGLIELDESRITSIDKKFLERVYKIITENISNSSCNVEFLAENLAISRVILHRKITSLIGESPVELIRRIRLKRAADLIEKNFGNITEIAYEVGFNNPAYFSECFKKQFGVSPSQYTK